eukprot:scaffold5143_cov231-Pinguiococcus_pyrenoidosus.AAC.8
MALMHGLDHRKLVYFDPSAVVEEGSDRSSESPVARKSEHWVDARLSTSPRSAPSMWSFDDQLRRSTFGKRPSSVMEPQNEKALFQPVPIVDEEQGGEYIHVQLSEDANCVRLKRSDVVDVEAEATRGVEDISMLDNFCEQAMLHTLRVRYGRNEIYTSVGPIVISINK